MHELNNGINQNVNAYKEHGKQYFASNVEIKNVQWLKKKITDIKFDDLNM